jgi:hypothetical protein
MRSTEPCLAGDCRGSFGRARILGANDQHAGSGLRARRAHRFGIAVGDLEEFVTDLPANDRKPPMKPAIKESAGASQIARGVSNWTISPARMTAMRSETALAFA